MIRAGLGVYLVCLGLARFGETTPPPPDIHIFVQILSQHMPIYHQPKTGKLRLFRFVGHSIGRGGHSISDHGGA